MLEDYITSQPISTKLLLNSFKDNKLVQAYLFVSNDKSFLMDYSLAFAKKLIKEEKDEKIYNMIQNNTYPELKIINPVNNVIKKDELNSLQKEFLVKPTLGNKLVYIINGADKLNSSSANTILKFLEEPNDSVVAILLTDNLSKVLPTIKSRCQNIILKNNETEKKDINYLYKQYLVNKNSEYSLDDFKNQLNDVINFIKLIERLKINTFIHYKKDIFDIYKTKEDFIMLFDLILYFYYDVLNYTLKRNVVYMNDFIDDIKDISKNNDINLIEKKLDLIEKMKVKLNSNMNLKLLIDEFIIRFSEV